MLYIFSIDEQLQAILKPDTGPSRSAGDTSYFLQPQYPAPDGKRATACPYWDPYHTEELNENFQNVFTFTVPADHDDAQYVTEGNLVAFKDLDQDWQLFEIKRVTDLHGDGLTRTAYCEHALYELYDDYIEDVRPTACSATFALTQALSGTRWSVGTVADLGLNSTNYYYHSALGAVQKVASVWGGELKFRVVVTGGIIANRYVDLLLRRGADTGKQWEYGRHTQEIEREVDLTTVITAAYGRGKGVEVGEGYGRRLDFGAIVWTTPTNPADKPLNQEWVGDPDALAQWGRAGGTRHRFGTFEDSEETDAAALLQKTWDYLQANKTPRATYRMTVMDLERLSGYEHEKVRLGDTTRGIDRVVKPALMVSVRVIGIVRNILRPEDTKITLGNFAPSLADEALKQRQINKVVSGAFSPTTGALATAWLDGIVNLLQNQLAATTTKFYTDANGAFIWEAIDGSSAMKIVGGEFALANAKIIDTQEWDWQTFGDGNGFTASMLNAGQIRTSLIQIFGNTEFYWDGDYLYIINPLDINQQIRLSKEGIKFTRDGGQTWGVAIGFDGILMEGRPTDPRIWYSPTGQITYNQDGEKVSHHGAFEYLGPLLAAFTRASTAYLSDGTLVASGVPRYEAVGSRLGVMSEEGCANIVATWPTGWTVAGDAGMVATDMGVLAGAALNTVRLTNSGATYGSYISPLFALSPSTTYTFRFKARGTVGVDKFNFFALSNTGTLVQCAVYNDEVTGVFAEKELTFTTTADITGTNQYIRFDHNGNDAGYIEIAEVELIQKPYGLSFPGYGATRAAETMTIPANVFTKGNWATELTFEPKAAHNNNWQWFWECVIDANNKYYLIVHTDGRLYAGVMSGGVEVSTLSVDSPVPQVGQAYSVMLSGNGSQLLFAVNGVQVGSLPYVEPVGTLPVNMCVGYSGLYGGYQANSLFKDVRFSTARTLAEHQAQYASGLPLTVDDATTYLMSCDGTLQPTLRYFGLYTKNGRFILVDPATGQGIEVWDGAVRKVLIGRLDDGTIGGEFSGCGVYSSTVQTGAKGATTFIGLFSDGSLMAKYNGKTVLQSWATLGDGNLSFGKAADGAVFGRLQRFTDTYPGMGIESVIAGENLSLRSADDVEAMPGSGSYFTVRGNFRTLGGSIVYLESTNGIEYHSGSGEHIFYGNLRVAAGTGTKYNTEETADYGQRLLAVRESPEQKYIDEGRAELVDGVCKVLVDPMFLQCIEPDSDDTPWNTYFTPKGPFTVYEAEIGTDYFIVKSHEPGINGKFSWKLSATRKGHAFERFVEVI